MKMHSFKMRDFRQVRQSGRKPLRPASLRARVEGSIGQRPIVPGAGIDD